jgi:hypothetical protein
MWSRIYIPVTRRHISGPATLFPRKLQVRMIWLLPACLFDPATNGTAAFFRTLPALRARCENPRTHRHAHCPAPGGARCLDRTKPGIPRAEPARPHVAHGRLSSPTPTTAGTGQAGADGLTPPPPHLCLGAVCCRLTNPAFLVRF